MLKSIASRNGFYVTASTKNKVQAFMFWRKDDSKKIVERAGLQHVETQSNLSGTAAGYSWNFVSKDKGRTYQGRFSQRSGKPVDARIYLDPPKVALELIDRLPRTKNGKTVQADFDDPIDPKLDTSYPWVRLRMDGLFSLRQVVELSSRKLRENGVPWEETEEQEGRGE
jgi:hypothetical protein